MNHITENRNEKLKTSTSIQILIERDDGKKKQKLED